mmetsp:Transcript_50042/g.89817  ORF Transcript_50042/g.89817 Transcript_50042/m.89817 type:complete len:143 (+) Transcript_50042:58-486(+)
MAAQGKYASFHKEEKKEDTTKVDQMEITFVHPGTRRISKKEVFIDPETWKPGYREPRFLISADLVNLLTEAQGKRHDRFSLASKKTHEHTCFVHGRFVAAERAVRQARSSVWRGRGCTCGSICKNHARAGGRRAMQSPVLCA